MAFRSEGNKVCLDSRRQGIQVRTCKKIIEYFPQIYIGDLGNDATRYELEDAFTPFGTVKNVWIAKRPPGG